MLFTNASIHATLLTLRHTGIQLVLTIYLTNGHGGKFISKQTWMKVTNSGATTKNDFSLQYATN